MTQKRLQQGLIVFICSSLGCGGTERCLTTLANYFSKQGHRICILTLHKPSGIPFFHLDSTVEVRHLALFEHGTNLKYLFVNVRGLFKLRSTIMKMEPTVILSFTEWINITTVLSLLRTRVPVIISERTDPRFHKIPILYKSLRKLLYPLSTLLITQTGSVESWFQSWFIPPKTKTIPNPLSMTGLSRLPSERNNTILAVGRLEKEKGFDILIQAFHEIHMSFPDWNIEILGEGPQRDSLSELILRLGLQKKAQLLGKKENVSDYMKRASVFVLSSRYEGFPNALIEAMAHGMGCICTDCYSGPREIIGNQQAGILIPIHDSHAMAKALTLIISDHKLRSKIQKKALLRAKDFSLENIGNAWELVVLNAIKNIT